MVGFTFRERFYIGRAIRQYERQFKSYPYDDDLHIYSGKWKNRYDLSWENTVLVRQHQREERERARVLAKTSVNPASHQIVAADIPMSWGTCYSEDHDHAATYSAEKGIVRRICLGGY